VTRHGDMAISAGGEAALERGKRGDDVRNLTGPKTEENQRGRFSCYK
jgi:hypothetical protein